MNKFQSEIMEFNISILFNKLASAFLKGRAAIVNCKHQSMLDDLKARSVINKNNLLFAMQSFGSDLDTDAIIENFCGFGREWTPSDAKVSDFAAEHGISHERAREVMEASMVSAQYNSQTTRGNLAGIYAGWLSDLDMDEAKSNDEIEKLISDTVIAAYSKAGQWMNRAEAILIEGAAQDLGVLLPKWEDTLPKVGQEVKAMKERIQKNLDKRAEQQAAAYLEASREINKNDW